MFHFYCICSCLRSQTTGIILGSHTMLRDDPMRNWPSPSWTDWPGYWTDWRTMLREKASAKATLAHHFRALPLPTRARMCIMVRDTHCPSGQHALKRPPSNLDTHMAHCTHTWHIRHTYMPHNRRWATGHWTRPSYWTTGRWTQPFKLKVVRTPACHILHAGPWAPGTA